MRLERKKVGLIKVLHTEQSTPLLARSEHPKCKCLPSMKTTTGKTIAITTTRTLPPKNLNKQRKIRVARVSMDVESTQHVGVKEFQSRMSRFLPIVSKEKPDSQPSSPSPEFLPSLPIASFLHMNE